MTFQFRSLLLVLSVLFFLSAQKICAEPVSLSAFLTPKKEKGKKAAQIKVKKDIKKDVPLPYGPNLISDYQSYWQARKILDHKKLPTLAEIQSAESATLSTKMSAPSRSLEKELDEAFWALEIKHAEAQVALKNYSAALVSFQRAIQGLPTSRWPFYWRDSSSVALAKICKLKKKTKDEFCLLLAKRVLDQFPKAATETEALRDLPFTEPSPAPEAQAERLSQPYSERAEKDEVAFDEVLEAYKSESESDLSKKVEEFIKEFPKSILRFRAQFLMAELSFKKGHTQDAEKIYRSLMDVAPLGFYSLVSSERLKLSMKDRIKVQPLMVDPELFNFNVQEAVTLKRIDELARMKKFEEVGNEIESLSRARAYGIDTILYLMGLSNKYQQHLCAFRLISELVQRQYDSLLSGEMLEIIFPFMFEKEITSAVKENKIDPLLVMSLTKQESGFKTGAISSSGALGLMQLMPFTALETREGVKLFTLKEAATNISVGTDYLASLLTKYEGNVAYALAAYNAGPTRLAKWRKDLKPGASLVDFVESIPYKETRDYVMSILRNRYWYQVRKGMIPESLFSTWKAPTATPVQ